MRHRVAHVVVKIAERCNLNCSYCYMYNHVDQTYRTRPPFISRSIFRDLVARIREHLDEAPGSHMALTFHGGEPMLMDLGIFRDLIGDAAGELGERIEFSMQTNGTLATDEWARVLRAYDVRVSVSIDGLPAVHNRWRTFHNGAGSYDAVLRGVRALQQGGLEPSLVCVVQPGADGLATYRHLRALGIRHFGFKFPDLCHDTPRAAIGTDATPMADYLLPIFDEWYAESNPSIRIRPFEAIIRGIFGGHSRIEDLGGGGLDYVVVESDGTIHGSDALRVCEASMSATGLHVSRHGFGDLAAGSSLIYRLAVEGRYRSRRTPPDRSNRASASLRRPS